MSYIGHKGALGLPGSVEVSDDLKALVDFRNKMYYIMFETASLDPRTGVASIDAEFEYIDAVISRLLSPKA